MYSQRQWSTPRQPSKTRLTLSSAANTLKIGPLAVDPVKELVAKLALLVFDLPEKLSAGLTGGVVKGNSVRGVVSTCGDRIGLLLIDNRGRTEAGVESREASDRQP